MGESGLTTGAGRRTSRWTVRRAVTVLAVMAAALPFAFFQLKGLKLDNRIETWLPADDPDAMVLDWFRERFEDRPGVLISWNGSSLNDPRMEAFARELAGPPNDQGVRTQQIPGIGDVRTPHDLIRVMLQNNVDRDTAVSELMGVVVGAGPLKVRLTAAGKLRQDDLVEEIRRRARQEIGIEVIFLPPASEQQSLSAEPEPVEEEFQEDEFSGPGADDPYPLPPPHDFQMRWAGMTPISPATDQMMALCRQLAGQGGEKPVEDCFFAPGAPAAVMVTMNETEDEKVDHTLDEIRKAAQRVGIPETDLHMGGSPYGRSELNREAKGASWNPKYPLWKFYKRSPVLTSAFVGIGMAFLVLQSARLATLVLLTDLFVAIITVALLPATGHSLNMVLVVLPNLIIVLTSSGAIHIANYWKHAAAERTEGAVSRAVKIGLQPCVLASITTAIGLTSLLTSVLRPVREFGMFAAVGSLISLGAILIGFPSMLRLWRGKLPSVEASERLNWQRLGAWLSRHSTAVISGSLALLAFGVFGLQWFHTETKVIRYFLPGARIVRDYEFLEENLAGIAPVEVIVSFDVGSRETTSDEFPDEDADEEAVVGDGGFDDDAIAKADDSVSARSGPQLTSVERMELVRKIKKLVAAYPEVSGTLALSDFRPPLEVPPPDASFLVKARFRRTVSGMDDFLRQAQEEGHQGLVSVAPVRMKTLAGGRPVDIPEGAELWRIRAQVALMTDLDYSELTADLDRIVSDALSGTPGTTHVVTGMIPLFLRTQNAVVESLVESFGLAFVVIAVVMMILLRHPLAGLITMLPNLLPVVFVFGMISLAGVPVDIGTMITASVALGIAVDDTLHQLTWFRNGLRQGLSRQQAISLGLSHCGPAMSQTSAAIGFGLLMLFTADLLLISRFGWLMASLIGAALLADLLFVPALLAGPLGTLIERRLPRSAPEDDETVLPEKAEAAAL